MSENGQRPTGGYLPVVHGTARTYTVNGHWEIPEQILDEFFHLLRSGYGKYKAADLLGYTWHDLSDVIERDRELTKRYEHALHVRLDEVEEALIGTAIAGNVQAQKFVLTNRRAGEWGDGQILVQRVRDREHEDPEAIEAAQDRESLRAALWQKIETAREHVLSKIAQDAEE